MIDKVAIVFLPLECSIAQSINRLFSDYGARIPRMTWTEYHSIETIYAFMRDLEDKVSSWQNKELIV